MDRQLKNSHWVTGKLSLYNLSTLTIHKPQPHLLINNIFEQLLLHLASIAKRTVIMMKNVVSLKVDVFASNVIIRRSFLAVRERIILTLMAKISV